MLHDTGDNNSTNVIADPAAPSSIAGLAAAIRRFRVP
jgi:hypothetical protein